MRTDTQVESRGVPAAGEDIASDFAEWVNPAPKAAIEPDGGGRGRASIGRVDIALVMGLFGLALAARWPFIARGETLLHSDEAIVGLMAQDIAAGERFPIYFYGQRYMGALEAYVIAGLGAFIENPIHALRLGPACFFAALVGAQYLMLTRWFGRRGGLIGAMALISSAPMFTQWSVSARGGYIEILLWGTLILWTYSEWFAGGTDGAAVSKPRRFFFGLLIGSGMWINPSIVIFVAPIVLHAFLASRFAGFGARPPAEPGAEGSALSGRIKPVTGGRIVGRRDTRRVVADAWRIAALPLLVVLGVVGLNATWSVWVVEGKVEKRFFLGLVSQPMGVGLIAIAGAAALVCAARSPAIRAAVRGALDAGGPMILGILAGAAPAAWYLARSVVGMEPMEPSLPLGIRPFWTTASTLSYLLHGLPLLLGADARPFMQLVTIGRESPLRPLDVTVSGLASGYNWVVLGGLITSGLVLVVSLRREIGRYLAMERGGHPPVMLLASGLAMLLGMYVLSGAAHDFNTIRYLIPMWALLPGLLAAVFVGGRFRFAGRLAPLCVCAAWGIGQATMFKQLGGPHPLGNVAKAMVDSRIDPAVGDIFDSHLLSYLTRQRCRVAEFEPFWSRLGHYPTSAEEGGPTNYIVQTRSASAVDDWASTGWPGPAPPELSHPLRERLAAAVEADPSLVVRREALADGYECVRLARPPAKAHR